MIGWRRRLQLTFIGYSEIEILRLGDLGKLTNERMNKLIRSKSLAAMENMREYSGITVPHMPLFGSRFPQKTSDPRSTLRVGDSAAH